MADLQARVSAGEIDPVYIVAAPDSLLAERLVAAVRDQVAPPEVRAFNYEVIEGGRLSADAILAAVTTLPMMAKRRMVLVRDLSGLSAKELEKLIPYVEDPAPETVLVALCPKLDGRIKFFQRAKKAGWVHQLSAPKKLEGWLGAEVDRQGVKISRAAQRRLIDVVGSDLARLSLSLEQLALYAGDRAIESDDVDDLIASTRERSVFELTDAIGDRDVQRALRAVSSLCDQRQSAIGVVMMLARHVRQLAQVVDATERGVPRRGLAREIGVPPFVADKLASQARRYDKRNLARGLELLARADRELKGMGSSLKVLGRPLAERVMLEKLASRLIVLGSQR